MDLSNIGGTIGSSITGWVTSGLFWTVTGVIIVAIIAFFYLSMSRRGKLKYNVLEVVRFGNGKTGVNLLKAGIFKNKTTFFGLLDYGSENIFKTSDGRKIQGAKTSQLHDVLGKKGFWVVRKTDDPKILIPLDKVYIQNLEALLNIAPADFRDVSTEIVNNALKETAGGWEKILPYLAIGVIVILCIITVVINQQMTNNTVDKVGKMLIEGCRNSQISKPSEPTTP